MVAENEADRSAYDPTEPDPPAQAPPVRSTAPQSDYTGNQVAVGFAVAVIGLLVGVGLPLALA